MVARPGTAGALTRPARRPARRRAGVPLTGRTPTGWPAGGTGWHIESRRLDDADALRLVAALQREYVLLYGGPDASPMHADHFVAPRGGFLVGYLDNTPVASTGWRRIGPVAGLPPEAHPAELKRMFVLPGHRGLGLSRRMLEAVEGDAAAHGITHLVLETGSRQPAAIALYRSSGYTDVDGHGWAEYHGQPGALALGRRLGPR